jgi:hypothetical protein
MTTRGLWIGAAVLLLAACGQAPGNPIAATGSPTTTGRAPLLFAVLEANGTASPSTYNTVAITGLDGHATAKTTFSPMPVPNVGCIGAIIPPSAHVAAGRVFFADAKGVVRSLAADGTLETAATFPMTSTQQMLSFAVSPDGSRLLGTVYTVPMNAAGCAAASTGAFTFDSYSAANGGAAKLVSHQSWTKPQNVLALTGWDSVGPIGTYPTVWASQGGGPGSTLGVFVRVDEASVRPIAPLADPSQCQVWSSIASGGYVCMQGDPVMTGGGTADQKVSQPVSVRGAGGTELWHFTVIGQNSPFGPSLAPDGEHVMVCCNDLNLADSHELLVGHDGSQVNLAKGFGAYGWLDSTTMIGWVNTNPLNQGPAPLAYVAANAPSTAVSIGFTGLFVGTVRA